MFTMSSICPTLGWENPIDLGMKNYQAFPNNNNVMSLDSLFLFDFKASSQAQNYIEKELDQVKQSESLQGTSSSDHFDDSTAKRLNHNASERVRRKKISNLYSSLRALLPPEDQKKKLSIPGTVVRVVEYIPELQQEVEVLIRKKEELMAKVTSLHGNLSGDFILDEKSNVGTTNETTSCSLSIKKMCDKEVVIQLSTIERISLSEVILLLEKDGYLVIHVSCFQSFGGRTFYDLHLWREGSSTTNFENLNETLLSVIQGQKQMQCITSVAMEQPCMQFGPSNLLRV